MIVSAWRIAKRKHSKAAFSGEGARLYGGRWNHPGTAMIYTAETQSLAALELLVHLDSTALLDQYILIEVGIEKSLILRLDLKEWPKDWRESPPPARLREIGDAWSEAGKSVALRVPQRPGAGGEQLPAESATPRFWPRANRQAVAVPL